MRCAASSSRAVCRPQRARRGERERERADAGRRAGSGQMPSVFSETRVLQLVLGDQHVDAELPPSKPGVSKPVDAVAAGRRSRSRRCIGRSRVGRRPRACPAMTAPVLREHGLQPGHAREQVGVVVGRRDREVHAPARAAVGVDDARCARARRPRRCPASTGSSPASVSRTRTAPPRCGEVLEPLAAAPRGRRRARRPRAASSVLTVCATTCGALARRRGTAPRPRAAPARASASFFASSESRTIRIPTNATASTGRITSRMKKKVRRLRKLTSVPDGPAYARRAAGVRPRLQSVGRRGPKSCFGAASGL